MDVVERTQQRFGDFREFEHHGLAAGLEHAAHFAQCGSLVGDVAQAEGNGHGVKMAVRKRQRFGVQAHVAQVADEAAVGKAVAADAEHFRVDVAEHDLAFMADAIREQGGDVASAAGKVEHAGAALDATGRDEMPLPQTVDAERHQVVHQVVFAGNRREHAADQLLLLVPVDVAIAEVDLLLCISHGFTSASILAGPNVGRIKRSGSPTAELVIRHASCPARNGSTAR